ncbi:hypothetical protein ACI78V_22800 [Geodermatophilus sp. SYSU D00742]
MSAGWPGETVATLTAGLRQGSPRPGARGDLAAAPLRDRPQDDDRQRGLIPI